MTPPPPPSRRGSFAGYVALTPADIRWVRLCAVFTNDRVKPPVHRAAFQALRRENRESWRSVKVTVLVRDFQADNKPLETGRCFPHNFSSNSNSSALAHISASPLKKKIIWQRRISWHLRKAAYGLVNKRYDRRGDIPAKSGKEESSDGQKNTKVWQQIFASDVRCQSLPAADHKAGHLLKDLPAAKWQLSL